MKKLLLMVFPLTVLTACQSVPQADIATEQGEVAPIILTHQMEELSVVEPSLSPSLTAGDAATNDVIPVTNAVATPMLNSDTRAHDMLLGVELNTCQHRLTSLGHYDKKDFTRYQAELNKQIALIKKYLSVRNTLSDSAATYYDEKYKASLDMTCAKIQQRMERVINSGVPLM